MSIKKVDVFEVESLLYSVHQMNVCSRIEESLVQQKKHLQRQQGTHGNKVHSKTWPGVSQDERPDIQCGYLRELLLSQVSYKRIQARMAFVPRTSKQLVKRSSSQLRPVKPKDKN